MTSDDERDDFDELSEEVRREPGAHEEIEARKAGIRVAMKLGELRERRKFTQVALAGPAGTARPTYEARH